VYFCLYSEVTETHLCNLAHGWGDVMQECGVILVHLVEGGWSE
jgi:hypothetical protein